MKAMKACPSYRTKGAFDTRFVSGIFGELSLPCADGLAGLVALECVYVPAWSGSHDAGTGYLANAFDIREGPLVTDHPGGSTAGLGPVEV